MFCDSGDGNLSHVQQTITLHHDGQVFQQWYKLTLHWFMTASGGQVASGLVIISLLFTHPISIGKYKYLMLKLCKAIPGFDLIYFNIIWLTKTFTSWLMFRFTVECVKLFLLED